MTRGPERKVEAYLMGRVRALGGRCFKLAPTVAGMPDRLVILPGGRLVLIEVKAPGGRLRPVQRTWHEDAATLGVTVVVLSSRDEVDEWVLTHSQDPMIGCPP